jgi:hypothetical protein
VQQPTDALWLLVRDPSVRATQADYLLVPPGTESHRQPDGVFTPAAYAFKIATRPDDPHDPVVLATKQPVTSQQDQQALIDFMTAELLTLHRWA